MIAKITHEDANLLYGYICQETGYSEDKLCNVLTDYCRKILKHGHNLPKRVLIRLRYKWGLSVQAGGAVWALAAATVGKLHVWVINHEDKHQLEILAE